MEKPSTKKPMNILKTMVFLNNFMKNYKLTDDEIKTICSILDNLSYGWEEYYGEESNKDFREYLFQISSTLKKQLDDHCK